MKTKEEIEELAEEFLLKHQSGSKVYHVKIREAIEFTYTQCQEDNKDKKYTEEDIKKCWILATNYALNQSNINLRSFINSLNKQD